MWVLWGFFVCFQSQVLVECKLIILCKFQLCYFKINHILKQDLTSLENFPQHHFEIDFTNIFINKAYCFSPFVRMWQGLLRA